MPDRAISRREFDGLVQHHCGPSWFGRRRRYECPICRAVWTSAGSGSWRHQTDGTEGRIVSVTVEYPDGTTQVFQASDIGSPESWVCPVEFCVVDRPHYHRNDDEGWPEYVWTGDGNGSQEAGS